MKRLIDLILLAIMYTVISCDTPSNVDPVFEDYFIKYYGEDGEQSGVDMLVNPDGTMILLGNSTLPAQLPRPFIVKVDQKGNVLWQRQCGGSHETAVDVELIKRGVGQGELIVATNVGPEASSQVRLIRIDQNGSGIDSVLIALHDKGTKQIVKTVTSLEHENGFAIAGYADANLFLETYPVAEDDQVDVFAFKVDENLDQIDTILAQGGEKTGSAVKVFDVMDNGKLRYLVLGYSDRPEGSSAYETNFEFLLTEPVSRSVILDKQSGTTDKVQLLASAIQTPPVLGEGYFLAGTSKNQLSNTGDIYLTKLNKNVADKSFEIEINVGKRLETVSVATDEPFGYYILANETTENERRNILLVQLQISNSQDGGNVSYITKSFGTLEGEDTAGAVATLQDGRVAIVGTMELETQHKMALIILGREAQ